MELPQNIKQNTILYLGVLVTGFIAGVSAQEAVLKWANLETVTKGSFVLKKDLTGTMVQRKDAIRDINNLIEQGAALKSDKGAMVTWLLQVSTFIHYLQLPPEVSVEGEKVSHLEQAALFAQTDPDLDVQVKKTLGILQGFRDAEQVRVSE